MPTARTVLAAAMSIALSTALLSGCASTERKERATGVPKADIYKPGGPNQALDKIAYDKRHSRALNISRLALIETCTPQTSLFKEGTRRTHFRNVN